MSLELKILKEKKIDQLLFIGFNQNYACLSVGCTNGFMIFNNIPFRENIKRLNFSGGVGIVEMLFRCNIIALVGGGNDKEGKDFAYSRNKVILWDDNQKR